MESGLPRQPGLTNLSLAGLGIIFLDVFLFILFLANPMSASGLLWALLIVASVPAITYIAYLTVTLLTASYSIDADYLRIHWGSTRRKIPLTEIRSVFHGSGLPASHTFSGLRLPGLMIGRGELFDPSSVAFEADFYATKPLAEQVLVVADGLSVGISPQRPSPFVQNLKAAMAAAQPVREFAPDAKENHSPWLDPRIQIVGAIGLLLNMALFAYVTLLNGWLPVEVPLHFNRLGLVDRLGPPSGLFLLPLIGLGSLLVNAALSWLFYTERREREIAALILSIGALLQIVAWFAVGSLLR